MTREALIEQIKRHEGHGPMKNGRHMPYLDSKGITTIGYGRNLQANGLRECEATEMLDNDVDDAIHACFATFPWFRDIDTVRQAVVAELVFNMGMKSWLGFDNTIGAIERRDWPAVGRGLRQSKWYRDVGPLRGDKMINQIVTGQW